MMTLSAPKLSFGGLSPFWPIPKDHLIMVLKSYFDGANKADLKLYDRIVVATVSGDSEQWDEFNAEWNEVLERHKRDGGCATPLHTTDAVSLWKGFSQKNGWNRDLVDDFICDCVRVIHKHMAVPSPITGELRPGLHIVTLTIYLDDYRKAREVNPRLPNSVNSIGASETMGFAFARGRAVGATSYHLYFDRGEPFIGRARAKWNSKKARIDVPLLANVDVIAEAISAVTPGLQMADLFAWCISHNDIITKRLWHRALNDLPWHSVYLDEGLLLQPTPGSLERIKRWRLSQQEKIEP